MPSVLVLGGGLVLINQIQTNAFQQNIELSQIQNLELHIQTLAIDFNDMSSDLLSLTVQNELQQWLDQPERYSPTAKQWHHAIAQEYLTLARQKRRYDQIRFLDMQGREIIRINFNQGQPEIVSQALLQSKANHDWFQETLKLQQGEIWISPLDLNVEHGKIEQPIKPVIHFATPVFDRLGQKQGIIVLNYLGNKLLEHLETQTPSLTSSQHPSAQLMLVNHEGFWLKGLKPQDEWGFVYPERRHRLFSQDFPAAWASIVARRQGHVQTAKGHFTFATFSPLHSAPHHRGEGLSAQPAAVHFRSYPWKLVSYIAADTQNIPLGSYTNGLLLFYGVCVMLIGIGSGVLTRVSMQNHRSQAALRESEHRYAVLAETSPVGIFRHDGDGSMVYANERWCEITGLTRLDGMGDGWLNCVHPDWRDHFCCKWDQIIEEGSPHYVESCLQMQDGRIKWVYYQVQPEKDFQDNIVGYVGSLTDITDLKHAEAALRNSERRFAALAEASPVGILRFNAIGECVYVNERCCDFLGITPTEALDFGWTKTLHPQDRDRLLTKWIEVVEQETSLQMEYRFQRRDGSMIWVYGQTIAEKNERGQMIGYVGTITDISDRKQTEAALEQLNQDLELRTQTLSQALENLKTTQDELIQSEKMAALGQLIAGVAHELNTPLGAIRSSAGHLTHFLATELQQLATLFQRLSPAQQGDFFALLQHRNQHLMLLSTREQRNLKHSVTKQLTSHGIEPAATFANFLVGIGIDSELETLLPLLKTPEAAIILKTAYQWANVQASIHNITTAAERAAKVVFALKTYARYDTTGKKLKVQLTEGIDTILTLYHNQLKHGIEVNRHYEASLPKIPCYPDELNQVWTNLIHNAMQAMNNQGTLTITVKRQADEIHVSIIDNGRGIPSELMPHIFDPFFTTKPAGEGSGLGLDIVKKIVEKHAGQIKVTSLPGHTNFTVSLPIELA